MDRDSLLGLAAAFLVLLFIFLDKKEDTTAETPSLTVKNQQFTANYGTPLLDGRADDIVWQEAQWLPLDQVWIGAPVTPDDFSGRYKILWDENNLYVLAEITDDTLIDIHPDGLLNYWDDDCLEIFVDEDASGGNHQYNYNAFAYHIALDGRVVDIRPDSAFAYFNEHCTTRRITNGKTSIWEVAVKIFDGNKYEDDGDNIPKMLKSGKEMGFALAYCDNDHSAERENFIGSTVVAGEDKNQGWIDAGIFGVLRLK
ncbi:MAG: sugar-binding protein [Saprospiraceae bacterium]|nr:sugar-binding protein [Saprospiraceae bacterium]